MITTAKNCLLVYRNKKLNNFDEVKSVVNGMDEYGYYFDKIDIIAYDSSKDITRSLKTCKANYENAIILCPNSMQKLLKEFIEQLYAAKFDDFGCMQIGHYNVFVLLTDVANRLMPKDIASILNSKYTIKFEKAYLKTVGAPSKAVADAIQNATQLCGEVTFNVSEKFGDCSIEMIYPDTLSKSVFDEVYRSLLFAMNEYVYAMENISLAERLIQLLRLRRNKISFAESFTGGGIGKRIVDVSGASDVYFEGLNTYSNEAKIQRLAVNSSTIAQFGAVSEQTAFEMAEGLIKSGNCNVCVATTGIAGPKSDNTSKPVGLIYIAVGVIDEGISVYKYNLKGNRESITETAINLALFLAYKTLK